MLFVAPALVGDLLKLYSVRIDKASQLTPNELLGSESKTFQALFA